VRSLYFTAAESGMTRAQLRHGEATGRWRRVDRLVYRFGSDAVTVFDHAMALVLATGGAASGTVAGAVHGLDAVDLSRPDATLPPASSHKRAGVRRRQLIGEVVEIGGIPCAGGLQTLVDLAAELDDLRWEQALESALRKTLVTIAELELWLPELGRRRTPGVARITRVLALRPKGAPPTGSLLETLFVQLVRAAGLPEPLRQVRVLNEHGDFVADVDFAWPELGLFIELDGQHHAGQPVHDARRETNVVAATGWLVGRFTWDEVVRYPNSTARQLAKLLLRARQRTSVDPSGR
jgi:very-short-patch-repair endonuclease